MQLSPGKIRNSQNWREIVQAEFAGCWGFQGVSLYEMAEDVTSFRSSQRNWHYDTPNMVRQSLFILDIE